MNRPLGKQRHRDGSIKVVGGRIYARIQFTDELTGKRREKLKRAANKSEAPRLIKQMRHEPETAGQETLLADQVTFGKVAERYKEIHIKPAVFQNGVKIVGRKSIAPVLSSLKALLIAFANTPIRRIRPSDIENYKVTT